jgi:predicted component of type VI protein secretion system
VRRLLVFNDGTGERAVELLGRVVVGRDPACDIRLDDSFLSRRHAEFFMSGNAVTVRDLGSRNGLYVNGTRAIERVLAEGDIVQIGPIFANVVLDRDRPLPAVRTADDTITLLDVPPPRPVAEVVAPPAAPMLVDEVVPAPPAVVRVRQRVRRQQRPRGVLGRVARLFGGAAAMTASYFAVRSMRRRSSRH